MDLSLRWIIKCHHIRALRVSSHFQKIAGIPPIRGGSARLAGAGTVARVGAGTTGAKSTVAMLTITAFSVCMVSLLGATWWAIAEEGLE